jgi:hypothetical protein
MPSSGPNLGAIAGVDGRCRRLIHSGTVSIWATSRSGASVSGTLQNGAALFGGGGFERKDREKLRELRAKIESCWARGSDQGCFEFHCRRADVRVRQKWVREYALAVATNATGSARPTADTRATIMAAGKRSFGRETASRPRSACLLQAACVSVVRYGWILRIARATYSCFSPTGAT